MKHESQASSNRNTTWRMRVSRMLQLVVAGMVIQTTSHLLGFAHPLLELASHFCMHVFIVGSLVAPLCWWFQCKRTAMLGFCCVAILAIYVQPWMLLRQSASMAQRSSQLRVLSWNVLAVNEQLDAVRELLLREDPDVLVLIEVRPGFLDELSDVTQRYPITLHQESWAGEGIAVLSRVEGTRLEFRDFTCSRQPSIVASIPPSSSVAGETLQLVAMHTLSPLPLYRAYQRNQQLDALSQWSQTHEGAIVVCGDLNITPWAHHFRKLIQSGLQDSRNGRGNQASWPSGLGPLGIPIDHVLYRGDCEVLSRSVLEEAPGSDHRPVAFEVDY